MADELDPSKLEIESRKNPFSKKKEVVVATVFERRPSGLDDDAVIGWTRFLEAWFMDRAPGSLNQRLIKALENFIINWRLEGRGGYKVPITLRNPKNPEEIVEIEAQTEKQPDFTYNPDRKKSIDDIHMPYRMWMDAVADLKFNLSGSSHGEVATKYEHLHWGGPVDITQDVPAADLDPDDPLDQMFDL